MKLPNHLAQHQIVEPPPHHLATPGPLALIRFANLASGPCHGGTSHVVTQRGPVPIYVLWLLMRGVPHLPVRWLDGPLAPLVLPSTARRFADVWQWPFSTAVGRLLHAPGGGVVLSTRAGCVRERLSAWWALGCCCVAHSRALGCHSRSTV